MTSTWICRTRGLLEKFPVIVYSMMYGLLAAVSLLPSALTSILSGAPGLTTPPAGVMDAQEPPSKVRNAIDMLTLQLGVAQEMVTVPVPGFVSPSCTVR